MENRASAQNFQARSTFNQFEKYVNIVSKWLYWIAGAGLIAMLVLVVADIFGIKVLSHPIPGGIEITAFLGVVVIGFAIAYVKVLRGHIQVDFIIQKFPPRAKAVIDSIMAFFGMAFFVALTWTSFDYAGIIHRTGEVSMTQKIPFYPFIYALAFCYLVTFLVLTVEFVKAIMKAGKKWTQ
jgi:TRAP-type C4-dicarboxylate transport system permease small subunit